MTGFDNDNHWVYGKSQISKSHGADKKQCNFVT
jgi:hypothetical protein